MQQMILADLRIGGRVRKVIMQAPKNGFFYVLDRVTGEYLSAEPFVNLNWARGIDEKGRPIENRGARYAEQAVRISPTVGGGHNWQPMSFNPDAGLVYIPAINSSRVFAKPADFTFKVGDGEFTGIGVFQTGVAGVPAQAVAVAGRNGANTEFHPCSRCGDAADDRAAGRPRCAGVLLACLGSDRPTRALALTRRRGPTRGRHAVNSGKSGVLRHR